MRLTIEGCGAGDVEAVASFLDAHWKRGHVLVANRRLLDWQYRNADGSYSFIVARRAGAIVGLLGFIPTTRYDPTLTRDNVVWLTTWKVRPDADVAALGVAMLQRAAASQPHVAIGAIGFNPETQPIYRALGYRVGEMTHYVARPGPAAGDAPLSADEMGSAREIDALAIAVDGSDRIAPRKTPRYFSARFANHPVYTYRVLALRDGGAVAALLATRVAEHDGRRAVRIVDFIGRPDVFARAGAVVQTLIRQHEADYADLYNAGLDPRAVARAGFHAVDPDGPEIVPDHFEPFENRNVRLLFALKSERQPLLFKADADQDRPNRMPAERG
jgi:hypothetical protein